MQKIEPWKTGITAGWEATIEEGTGGEDVGVEDITTVEEEEGAVVVEGTMTDTHLQPWEGEIRRRVVEERTTGGMTRVWRLLKRNRKREELKKTGRRRRDLTTKRKEPEEKAKEKR